MRHEAIACDAVGALTRQTRLGQSGVRKSAGASCAAGCETPLRPEGPLEPVRSHGLLAEAYRMNQRAAGEVRARSWATLRRTSSAPRESGGDFLAFVVIILSSRTSRSTAYPGQSRMSLP